jgi:hypothetical protein
VMALESNSAIQATLKKKSPRLSHTTKYRYARKDRDARCANYCISCLEVTAFHAWRGKCSVIFESIQNIMV